MNHKPILMYSRSGCPYCLAARGLLSARQAAWTEVSLDAEPHRRDEMIARTGRRTVPQVFIGDLHVGGYDDLHALDQSGQLDRLLGD